MYLTITAYNAFSDTAVYYTVVLSHKVFHQKLEIHIRIHQTDTVVLVRKTRPDDVRFNQCQGYN